MALGPRARLIKLFRREFNTGHRDPDGKETHCQKTTFRAGLTVLAQMSDYPAFTQTVLANVFKQLRD